MSVTVEVTAEDIAEGMPKDPCRCPVALAFGRAWPSAVRPMVSDTYVTWGQGPLRETAWLPAAARPFLLRFDEGLPVAPVTFELEPEESPD